MKFRFSFFALILFILYSPLFAAKKSASVEKPQLSIEEESISLEDDVLETGTKKHEWCIFYKNENKIFAGPFDTVEEALEAWITNKKIKSGSKYYIGRDQRLFTNTPETYYRRKYEAVQKIIEEKETAEKEIEQQEKAENKKGKKKKKKEDINPELQEEEITVSEEILIQKEETSSESEIQEHEESANEAGKTESETEDVTLTKKQLKEKQKAEKAEKKAKEKEEKEKLKKAKKKKKSGDSEENPEEPETPVETELKNEEKLVLENSDTPVAEIIEPEEIQKKILPHEPGIIPEELRKQNLVIRGTTSIDNLIATSAESVSDIKSQDTQKTQTTESNGKTKYSPFEVPLSEETSQEKNKENSNNVLPEFKFSETENTNKENKLNRPYLSDFISNDIFGIPENDNSNIEEDFIEEAKEADYNGVTALMKAVKEGNDWKIRTLIRSKADVNAKDKEGWTPLMYAARYQSNLSVLNLILAEKADVKAVNNYGLSPLIIAACFNDNPDVIQKILSYYSPADKEVQKAFVHLVSTQQSDNFALVSKVKIFLDFGFPVNSYYEGKTPLMYTCKYCSSTKVIKLLLDKNAAVNVRSTEGKTAFDYAQNNKALPKDEIYWSLNKR